MVKTYKRGQDLKTDEFSTMEDTKKHPTKVVAEAGKIGQSATSKAL